MSKPLYQQLNEQRTQGDWRVFKRDGLFPSIIMHGSEDDYIRSYGRTGFCMNVGGVESVIKANAQYTALAVNNLHHLAEALDEMNKVVGMYLNNTEKHPDFMMTKDSTITQYFREAIKKGEQALSRIS